MVVFALDGIVGGSFGIGFGGENVRYVCFYFLHCGQSDSRWFKGANCGHSRDDDAAVD